MWMGKIGQKSAAFINHKPFHPGSWQNQEKIWLAEQKHKEELRKQAELAERRAEEVKIQELRRALYNQGTSASTPQVSPKVQEDEAARKAAAIEARKREAARAAAIRAAELRKGLVKSVLYEEDVYLGSHSHVWGSLFDKETNRWGFKCCGVCDKTVLKCPSTAAGSAETTHARKHRKRSRKEEAASPNPSKDERVGKDSGDVGAVQEGKTEAELAARDDAKDVSRVEPVSAQSCSKTEERAVEDSKRQQTEDTKKRKVVANKNRSREGGLAGVLQLLKEENAFGDYP
ncbi:Arabidopsis thaliana At4g37120/C7A10_240,related [Neospora caninum Liverpool]|uniref:Arabidopsis thaliana At4g37120/C7A10_240,related n=1 Tax=Neospora caninum (strain Liverpool) TaxID=572307 RepID=F0VG30_NEOCL|nr:Arabidopsis thaliana At4g37120/C7A10_240,related [Neospora caninum Liverpool]CBZ52674.1 Arabidopsis thaliana At4g37120/C7A10_240,related [Neospora caninum Liverpool]CEL66651.1 TPA: Arabidopsis thaliana At4g37120/C7A10_240,related [Neospora caninum Liverpool]|eukprot:XP_003882706.1 Arabidopsis thaliana At4g37120/C7A10_240,related [Neospora caninum Liverpool]